MTSGHQRKHKKISAFYGSGQSLHIFSKPVCPCIQKTRRLRTGAVKYVFANDFLDLENNQRMYLWPNWNVSSVISTSHSRNGSNHGIHHLICTMSRCDGAEWKRKIFLRKSDFFPEKKDERESSPSKYCWGFSSARRLNVGASLMNSLQKSAPTLLKATADEFPGRRTRLYDHTLLRRRSTRWDSVNDSSSQG